MCYRIYAIILWTVKIHVNQTVFGRLSCRVHGMLTCREISPRLFWSRHMLCIAHCVSDVELLKMEEQIHLTITGTVCGVIFVIVYWFFSSREAAIAEQVGKQFIIQKCIYWFYRASFRVRVSDSRFYKPNFIKFKLWPPEFGLDTILYVRTSAQILDTPLQIWVIWTFTKRKIGRRPERGWFASSSLTSSTSTNTCTLTKLQVSFEYRELHKYMKKPI